ncbi:T-lymphocyte activation antigen CD80, partial [Leptosomus discolor]
TGYALEKEAVKSKVGEKVSLPCCHEIPSSESLRDYRVYWQKNITEVVLAYAEGKEISKSERYENRTDMDNRTLTLWISPVHILDNGSYQCVVQHLGASKNPSVVCDKTITLFVTGRTATLAVICQNGNQTFLVSADFTKPNITAEVSAGPCESTEMAVRCSSHGGFPKPTISGALNNKSVVWNDSWVSKSSLSLYNVTAKVWLSVTENASFTCSVEYNGFSKSTSLLLKKSSSCIVPTVPPASNVITASSIIIIIFLLAITLAARYLPRRGKCSSFFKKQSLTA